MIVWLGALRPEQLLSNAHSAGTYLGRNDLFVYENTCPVKCSSIPFCFLTGLG